LPALMRGLNADARRRFGIQLNSVLSINLAQSSQINVMQMNDIILGAIASHRNERHTKPNASAHKTHLAELVRERLGVPNFGINTTWDKRAFTLWNWKAQKLWRPRS
jgi:hypothetical protein